uniref:Inorganic phosphate transporter n=1 Tax=Heterorhabditis bacteriophora TaxID=37862 RepID=A0A1I7X063_HETBA
MLYSGLSVMALSGDGDTYNDALNSMGTI